LIRYFRRPLTIREAKQLSCFGPRRTTDNPLYADDRNFNKVEKWAKDCTKVDRLMYAGNNLENARELFAKSVKHRPRIVLTSRQQMSGIAEWPHK
jgi:hypothetical protein